MVFSNQTIRRPSVSEKARAWNLCCEQFTHVREFNMDSALRTVVQTIYAVGHLALRDRKYSLQNMSSADICTRVNAQVLFLLLQL